MSVTPFSLRLEPEVVTILHRLSERHRLPDSMMVERLIIEAARELKMLDQDAPNVALFELCEWIRDRRRDEPIDPHPDFTLTVFERIQGNPDALALWNKATTTRVGERVDKRIQWVNARIGRFCKHLIGWESGEKVVLARNAGKLIKGYTRLVKPSSSRTHALTRRRP